MSKVRDFWLIENIGDWGGGKLSLRDVFEHWEKAGIEIGRPFTVTVDVTGQMLITEQERE